MTGGLHASRAADAARVADAADAARVAADAAGVEVVTIEEPSVLRQACRLLLDIWPGNAWEAAISAELLRVLALGGGYVASAFDGGRMVAACAGLLTREEGQIELHSHILGVVAGMRDRHVGLAMKLHQRAWALEQGLGVVRWTYDPLVRRNAWFNIARLGAGVAGYRENFYGAMNDGINAGDESDRCIAHWDVAGASATAAAAGRVETPDVTALRAAGAAVVLDEDAGGAPRTAAAGDAPLRLVRVPEDIVALRRTDARLALRWRFALRGTLGAALAGGFRVSGFAREGWYMLSPTAPS